MSVSDQCANGHRWLRMPDGSQKCGTCGYRELPWLVRILRGLRPPWHTREAVDHVPVEEIQLPERDRAVVAGTPAPPRDNTLENWPEWRYATSWPDTPDAPDNSLARGPHSVTIEAENAVRLQVHNSNQSGPSTLVLAPGDTLQVQTRTTANTNGPSPVVQANGTVTLAGEVIGQVLRPVAEEAHVIAPLYVQDGSDLVCNCESCAQERQSRGGVRPGIRGEVHFGPTPAFTEDMLRDMEQEVQRMRLSTSSAPPSSSLRSQVARLPAKASGPELLPARGIALGGLKP